MQYAVSVQNLKKRYGKFEALKGISFNIKKGEVFGFLGPNGAGKSTTINILAGLLNKDSGDVKILGKEVDEMKQEMNIATAYSNLTGVLTVYQNLKIFAKLYSVKNADAKVLELLKAFEIEDIKNQKFHDLSSGQATRVNLCKGLINNPKVLLLDECTVGLDPAIAEKTRQIILNYNKEHKTSILFTSHMMNEVEEMCDRVAFISRGKILKIGTPEMLKRAVRKQTVEIVFSKPTTLKSTLKGADVLYMSDKRIVFEMDDASRHVQDIILMLTKQGVKIKDLHIRKPDLRDVFVKAARGEMK